MYAAAGDTLTRHTLDKPPTSSDKILLRFKSNVFVSGATARTCLSAHIASVAVLLLLLLLLLDPSASSFIHF